MARPMFEMKLKGWRQLAKNYDTLAQQMSSKEAEELFQGAWMEAAEIVVTDAKLLIGHKSGRTASKIGVGTVLNKGERPLPLTAGGFARAYVGLAPNNLSHLIEFGTVERFWKPSADATRAMKSTGRMPATPFFRPAWELNKEEVLKRYGKAMGKHMEALASALGAKQLRTLGRG